jgi:hypothetical protein
MQPALRQCGPNQIMQPTQSQQNHYRLLTILNTSDSYFHEQATHMKDSATRAQHYHDLALEFLVMTRFTAIRDIQDRYRMMGQHYLARAGAELARAKLDCVGAEA